MKPLCPTCRGDCCSNESGSLVVAHGSALALHRCPDCPDGYALAIDLAAARLAALLEAECENTALRAEVGRLRGVNDDLRLMVDGLETAAHEERAAVVAWLRTASQWMVTNDPLNEEADAIERGEHRSEEKT